MIKSSHCLAMALLLGCGQSAFSASVSLSDELGTPDLWRHFNWSDAPSSVIWKNPAWVSYMGDQSPQTRHLKIQALMLEGSEWQITLDKRLDHPEQPYQVTLYTPPQDRQNDHCNSLYRWAYTHFGPPSIAMDGSYHLNSAAGHQHIDIDRLYQWDIGTTRITQVCTGQSIASSEDNTNRFYAVSYLRASPASATARIHPLLSAHCNRSLLLASASRKPLAMGDIDMVIDQNSMSIRRPTMIPIQVRKVLINQQQVQFSITLDNAENDYQIDLANGQLAAETSIAGIRAGEISGQCQISPILTGEPVPTGSDNASQR